MVTRSRTISNETFHSGGLIMIKTYTVVDEAGLHARPASLLVQVATKYNDDVYVIFKEKKLTLKSIMAVMSLGIPEGANFSIEVIGENETVIFEKLEEVLTVHKVI